MTVPVQFQTNYEGSITLDELAKSTGCTLEQFLGDSVLSILICVEVAEENRRSGKQTPTLLLFEHESREGYETYDVMQALTATIPSPRTEDSFPVNDPIAEDASLTDLPLSADTITELNNLSQITAVPPRRLLEEGVNLRWMLKQAADKSLDVLLEGSAEDEYVTVPTSFID